MKEEIRFILVESSEYDLKVGSYVNWLSQGIIQWKQSRRIVHINIYGYVYCDGSMTAISISELIPEEVALQLR